ncbi:MAG: chromosome segregation ATPase [Cyanobacteria bacterium P01_G01_bin.54]
MPPKPHYSKAPHPHPAAEGLGAGIHSVGSSRSRAVSARGQRSAVPNSNRPNSKFAPSSQPGSATQSVRTPSPAVPAVTRPAVTHPPVTPADSPQRGLPWQWLAAGIVVISGVLGFGSAAVLLKLPTLPNCPQMFLPTASASVRLYCAQLAANKGTQADLLEAVHLIEGLPQDHPLRPEIDRYLSDWVEQLLTLADETFQAGELDEAIDLAQELELYIESALIRQRITDWQALWEKAEAIETEARAKMKDGAWGEAFRAAGELTQLDNRYWATTRYDELYGALTAAREESKKLDDAFAKLNQGGLENLLSAIDAAEQVPVESPAHNEAQTLIAEAKQKLIALAVRSLKGDDWQTAMQIVNRIPTGLKLQDEIDDLTLLADAASIASFGTQINLEDAILEAQRVEPGRPLYNQAQALIQHWQATISASLKLDAAIELAREGTMQALAAAIAEARSISAGNPRHGEAQRRIRDWQAELERRQDQPILDRAESLALSGNLNGAIAEAKKISQGRALHSPAQQRIQDWQRQLATGRDRPLLQRANNLANQGRYDEAIELARQIGSGSPLHGEAQTQISNWQAQVAAQGLMAQAEQQARTGTPEALSAAIQSALQVGSNSPQAGRARESINTWSSQLLRMAQIQARSDINGAIRIARLIPSASNVYSTAQTQIETWERLLASSPEPQPEAVPEQ